jgi:hypothetical protein
MLVGPLLDWHGWTPLSAGVTQILTGLADGVRKGDGGPSPAAALGEPASRDPGSGFFESSSPGISLIFLLGAAVAMLALLLPRSWLPHVGRF